MMYLLLPRAIATAFSWRYSTTTTQNDTAHRCPNDMSRNADVRNTVWWIVDTTRRHYKTKTTKTKKWMPIKTMFVDVLKFHQSKDAAVMLSFFFSTRKKKSYFVFGDTISAS